VVRKQDNNESWCDIHEVYYDEQDNILFVSNPIAPQGSGQNSLRELNNDIERMSDAIQRDVIEADDLREHFNEPDLFKP